MINFLDLFLFQMFTMVIPWKCKDKQSATEWTRTHIYISSSAAGEFDRNVLIIVYHRKHCNYQDPHLWSLVLIIVYHRKHCN